MKVACACGEHLIRYWYRIGAHGRPLPGHWRCAKCGRFALGPKVLVSVTAQDLTWVQSRRPTVRIHGGARS